MRNVLAAAALLTLAGCANIESPLDDGYDVGDLTATPLVLQARYCDTADPRLRAVRMVLLQRSGVQLPDKGACADIVELLND